MTSVAQLTVELAADYARLMKDMNQATSAVTAASQKMQKTIDGINGALGAIGVGLSVAGIASFFKKAIDSADAMDELSQKVGTSVEDLAGLQLAFKFGGVEADALQSALTKLSGAAFNGNDGFKALSISAKNSDGTLKSTRQLIGEVADKFQGLDDGAQKTALAVEIFGKSGANLIPLLNGGAEGLAEFDSMAKNLGLTISSETAAQAAKFNDTLDLLMSGLSGVGLQLSADLLPTLQTLAEKFLTAFNEGDRLSGLSASLKAAMKVIATGVIVVVDAFRFAINTIGGFFGVIKAAITGDFEGAVALATKTTNMNFSIIGDSVKTVAGVFDQSGGSVVNAMANMSSAQRTVVRDVKASEQAAKDAEKAQQRRIELLKKLAEASNDYAKEIQGIVDAENKVAASIQEQVAKFREQTALVGLSSEELRAYKDAQDDAAVSVLEFKIRLAEAGFAARETIPALQAQISAFKQLKIERNTFENADAQEKSYRAVLDEVYKFQDAQQQVAQQFEQDLVRAFEQAFIQGRGLSQAFKLSVQSQVFKITLEPVFKDLSEVLAKEIRSVVDQVRGAVDGQFGSGSTSALLLNSGSILKGFKEGVFQGAQSAAGAIVGNAIGGPLGSAIGAKIGEITGKFTDKVLGIKARGGPKQTGGFGYQERGADGVLATTAKDIADGIIATFETVSKELGVQARINPYLFIGVDPQGTANTQLAFGATVNGQSVYDRGTALGGVENVGRSQSELQSAVADATIRTIIGGLKQLDFADNIDAILAPLDAASTSFEQLSQALELVQIVDRLNDSFGKLGSGLSSLSGASADTIRSFVQAVGGLDGLNERLQFFYQEFTSDSVKFSDNLNLITEVLASVGSELPTTRAAFSQYFNTLGPDAFAKVSGALKAIDTYYDTIEQRAQQIAEEEKANAEALANQRLTLEQRLLQLQGNTAELRRRELAALDPVNRAIQEQIYALEDNLQLQNQRTDAIAKESAALERVVGLGRSIAEYVRGLSINNVTLTPQQRLQSTGSEFNRLLTLARGGDENALSSITSVSDSFLKSAQDFYGATEPFQNILERVKGELGSLPAVKTYQEKVLDTLRAIAGSVDGLDDQFVVDLSIAAKSEIEKLIKFVAVTDQLPDDLKSIALATSSSLVRTVDAVLASGINNDAKALALKSSDGINRILNLSLGSINAEAKSFAVASSSELTRFINAVLGSSVSDEAKRLAFANSDSLTRTIQIALGVSDQIAQRALFSTSETVYKTVQAILGSTASQQAVAVALAANNEVITTVNAVLGQNTSAEFAQFLQTGSVNRQMFLNTVLNSSVPDSLKNLVLNAQSASDRAVVLSVGLANQLSGDVRKVLDSSSSTIQKLFQVGLQNGTLNATEQALLYAESQTIQKTINGVVNTGNLDATQSAVLKAATGISNNTIQAQLMFANSLSPDGGILAYSREQVAAAYFHNGRYLSHWLSDIATYTAQTVGAIQAMQAMFQVGQGGWARVGGLFDGYYMGVFSQARNGPIATFAQGGLVTGPGTGTSDSINARLSNREFVMKAAAVKRFGVDFMDQINAGNLPVMPVGMPQTGGFDIDVLVAELKAHRAVSEKLLMTLERKNFEPTIQTSVNVNGRQIKQDVIEQLSDDFRRGVQRFVGA